MPDETPNPETEPVTTEPEAPETPETKPEEQPEPQAVGDNQNELKAVRREAQNLRQRLRAAEQAAAAAQETARTLADKNSDLTNQVQRSQVERAVVRAAAVPQVGAKRPEALVSLIDISRLTFDAEKGVMGIDDELARIKSEFPELFNVTGSADGGAGGGALNSSDMNQLIRRRAGRH